MYYLFVFRDIFNIKISRGNSHISIDAFRPFNGRFPSFQWTLSVLRFLPRPSYDFCPLVRGRKTRVICEENSRYMRGKLTLYARKTLGIPRKTSTPSFVLLVFSLQHTKTVYAFTPSPSSTASTASGSGFRKSSMSSSSLMC